METIAENILAAEQKQARQQLVYWTCYNFFETILYPKAALFIRYQNKYAYEFP